MFVNEPGNEPNSEYRYRESRRQYEQRIGVLGGMFDPPHNGHLAAARHARHVLGLTRVKLVPCNNPCHRPPTTASGAQRLAMTELAVAVDEGLEAEPMELTRPGPSYTVHTLAALRAHHPKDSLVFILGFDAFAGFTDWRGWRRILRLAHLFVLGRPPNCSSGQEGDAAAVEDGPHWARLSRYRRRTPEALFSTPSGGIYLDSDWDSCLFFGSISSSVIRAQLAGGGFGDCPLPSAVLHYIRRQRLYGIAHD